MRSRPSELFVAICRGVLVLALSWLTAFALIRLGDRVFGGWAASDVGVSLACAFGVYLALRLRVRLVAYVLAGQLAFVAAELSLHSIYGIRSVQGGPTHFAVMLAGTLGVALGWYLSRRATPNAPEASSGPSPLTIRPATTPAPSLASPAA